MVFHLNACFHNMKVWYKYKVFGSLRCDARSTLHSKAAYKITDKNLKFNEFNFPHQ